MTKPATSHSANPIAALSGPPVENPMIPPTTAGTNDARQTCFTVIGFLLAGVPIVYFSPEP